MPDNADLTLESIAKMIAGFLVELDLRDVTLAGNDWRAVRSGPTRRLPCATT